MKKRLFSVILLLALIASLSAPVFADHLTGDPTWTVTFTTAAKIESSFKTSEIQDAVSTLQPGDDITVSITLRNKYKESVDWYMMNSIIKSMEDDATASGGAYSYVLEYRGSNGAVRELYNSEKVGGQLAANDTTTPEGLHEVNDALKDYFYLEAMPTNGTGVVTLTVALEGETQGNRYQDTLADLRMRFAAEITPTRTVVKTGDETNNMPYYLGMTGSGVIVLLLAIDGVVRRKKKGGNQA